MSFTTFLTVVTPYLFIFFVLFIAVPFVIAGLVMGLYEMLTVEKESTAEQKKGGHHHDALNH